MKIGIAITRAASIDATWTTVHLATEALSRGYAVRFIEPWDYEVDAHGRVIARAHAFDKPIPPERLAAHLRERVAPRRYVDLSRLDVLMIRAAPLNLSLMAFAELAKERGVRVVNDPRGLIKVTHKAWLAALPGVKVPPSVVTKSRASAELFYRSQAHGVIVKPARGSGGKGVFKVPPRRIDPFDEAFSGAALRGDGYVVVQRYLREAEQGEKRLVWLDGTVLGGYLRRRAPGEFRHNLKRGGIAEPTVVTPADVGAVAGVTPHLLKAGVRLAGIDVIGGWLIEVNVLNPGGAYHADRLSGTRIAAQVLSRLVHPPQQEKSHGLSPDTE